MGFASSLADTMYGVKGLCRTFEAEFPEEPVLTALACKGLRHDGHRDIGLGLHWNRARRGTLLVTRQRLMLGGWHIPVADIESSTFHVFNGVLSTGLVLGNSWSTGLRWVVTALETTWC